jgi:nitrate/nitrite transporter NarK
LKDKRWKNLENPFRFVLLIGIANLFADMTYEGGGSINGQYMAKLGATAAAISISAGIGEFLGYTVRSLSGYLSDKTGRPWLITFIGYIIGIFSVPAMVFAQNWQTASVLIFRFQFLFLRKICGRKTRSGVYAKLEEFREQRLA